MRQLLPIFLFLTACGEVAFDTRVAETQTTRLAMIESLAIGDTTETQWVTRWGNPLQKVRDGGRVEYIYRTRTGDHDKYVIVTFEYGVAIAIRSNDTEGCRASFAPRVPGYGWDTPDIVKPVGWCQNDADPYNGTGLWDRLNSEPGTTAAGQTVATRPGVTEDVYVRGKGE